MSVGKIRDRMPKEILEIGDRLAVEEHQKFLNSGQELSEVITEPDETLGVYALRLSNKEKLLLRQLAVKTGRPAAEIARDFIQQGIERSLSPSGKIRPESEHGIKYLAFIAQSLSTFVDVFEMENLRAIAEERLATREGKKQSPHRKRA